MRVQIFSDLHAGVAPLKRITVAKDVALVIVAGDVAEGAQNAFVTLRRIVPEAVPVVFTMGNHEYYRRFLGEELALARALAPNFNIHLLENDCIVVGDGTVRVAGASLWTDYRMFGDSNAPAAMHAARVGMNDHRLIGWKRKPWERFRPQEAALLHAASRAFSSRPSAPRSTGSPRSRSATTRPTSDPSPHGSRMTSSARHSPVRSSTS